LQHASRVSALAVFDASAEAEDRARAVKYRLFASVGRRLGLPPALMDAQIVPLFFTERTRRDRPELVERFVRAVHGFPREGIARAAIAVVVRRTDVLARIEAIRVPTLVVCGKEDRATEPLHSERIAARIAGARLVLLDGAAHVGPLEQPKAVNDVLVPFVRNALA
jgi:pimeloyl-ACP methyl ester carboxylesterase